MPALKRQYYKLTSDYSLFRIYDTRYKLHAKASLKTEIFN